MTTTPDFEPGDIAIVLDGRSGPVEARTVVRLTKTRVVLDSGDWYPRDTLRRRPEYAWHSTYLVAPGDPRVAKALERAHEDREGSLARRVANANFGVTLDDIRRVIAIADAHLELSDTDEDLRACQSMRRAFMPVPLTVTALVQRARANPPAKATS